MMIYRVLFFVLLGLSVHAQDVLITKDADTIECRIINITDDIIHFQVKERDTPSKVPFDVLHKYLFRMEWETVGALNAGAFEEKKMDIEKARFGSIKKSGFYLQKAGNYQMAAPFIALGGIGFGVGGGLLMPSNRRGGIALIAVASGMGVAALITQIVAAVNTNRAGQELQYVPIK